jgi:hypothetical protein
LACEKEFYAFKNILYMDCITTACTMYVGEHMEYLKEEDGEGDGEGDGVEDGEKEDGGDGEEEDGGDGEEDGDGEVGGMGVDEHFLC